MRKPTRSAYKGEPGYVPNPILKYPRNAPCPCGSGSKFKKCCLAVQPMHVAQGKEADLKRIVNERLVHDTTKS